MLLKIKDFSKTTNRIPFPDLLNLQRESFDRFINVSIKKIFQELCPIYDYSGENFKIEFLEATLGEPKLSEEEVRYRGATYQAPLRVKVRLTNLKTNQVSEQEIYFGEIPILTKHNTFLINGVERIIIFQLVRSPGVYFTFLPYGERKLFGAKIIPYRGAWLEFQVEASNILQVRIDRRKKVPATTLLRAFGLEQDEEILDIFKEVDSVDYAIVPRTLEKDNSKNQEEALIEIHRKLKPTEPSTLDNAFSFFENLFKNPLRYDLGEPGRYKINQRLNLEGVSRQIELQDLIETVKEILRLTNDPLAQPDEIDSLENRRIRDFAELLENQWRSGLLRLIKNIQDRLAGVDPEEEILPSQIVYARPLMNSIKEFFGTFPLSQLLDQTNPLADLEHKRRVSASGPGGLSKERAGFEVRDIHPSHFGRLCPIQTPEGQNIGLISYLSLYTKRNDLGFLETPYLKVENGKITSKVVYLDAHQEKNHILAPADIPVEKNKIAVSEVIALKNGKPERVKKEEVEYIGVSLYQNFSNSVNLIPFLGHDDANRAQMGGNMQRQAVPLIKPEPPLVSTGLEELLARNSGYLLFAEADGKVLEVDNQHILVEYQTPKGKKKVNYQLIKYRKTNQFTCINQKPLVRPGQKIKKGDILADGPAIRDGVLALGQNLLVAFLSWYGYNYEDAIVVSERVLKDDIFTSIYLEDFVCDVMETKLGPEQTTYDIPGVAEEKLKDLDEEGIVRIGAQVRAGDILVGKITPKKELELSPEEKLLKAIFGSKAQDVKDSSLYLEHGKEGRVVRVRVLARNQGEIKDPGVMKRIIVEIGKLRKLQVGDKLTNRHGNKGIISKIVPEEDMPWLPDGRPVDLILSPLGVVSRMNLGQILETHLGYSAKILGYRAITPGIGGATEEEVKEELKKAGLPEDGKITLYDGLTGEPFKEKVTVGYMYVMKLIHMVEDKIHARSVGPYSLVTQQPLGGKSQFGGQRFGEMEVWALEGYGASATLQEMLTIKSDDLAGRINTYASIIRNEEIKPPTVPTIFNVLIKELQSLGFKIEIKYKEEELIPPAEAEVKEEKLYQK